MKDMNSLENDKFDKMREVYVESFPEKIQILRKCWANISEEDNINELLADLRVEVHKITGSSGSHEFDNIYAIAKKAETCIVDVINEKSSWEHANNLIGNQIQQLVNVLERELSNYQFSEVAENDYPHIYDLKSSHRELVVFIISVRKVELSLLSNLLEGRGFSVKVFNEIQPAQEASVAVRPSVVILDLGDAHDYPLDHDTKSKFKSAQQNGPEFVIISRRDDIATRTMAARFEAAAFFTTPINTHNFSSTLDVLLETRNNLSSRVLLVGDKSEKIQKLEKTLKDEKIECRVFNDYNNFTDELVNFKPGLILIACNQRDNWRDYVKIVRLHETYFNMPIICHVDVKNDQAKIINDQVMMVGADDCMFGSELQEDDIKIIKQRILRFKRANQLIIVDSLTGALNRDAFMDRANEEISLAIRRGESVCLAMIDVDHFKQINDQNGHVVGDYVLRHISDYLNNRLRRSDIVGRYAGDEFLVLLPDTDLDSAYLVLDLIRKNLVAHNIHVNNVNVRVSISLGLVSATPTEQLNVESLIVDADKKLYEAKVAGRNMLVAGVA